jgi:signal transduction histidine kinase
MREVARAEYKDGYADVYDARDVLLVHMRCDGLVGYGPEGFVVKRGNCYWAHNANGTNAMAPMTPFDFGKKKWDMHDTFLRIVCGN